MNRDINTYISSRWLLLATAIVVVVILFYWCFLPLHTTILLVRHADRLGEQDVLNQDGIDRAAKLVHVVAKANVTAIFHSEALRTQRTAEDLAVHLGIVPVQIDSSDISGLVTEILRNNTGRTVLVVSHSNRVPDIIDALGGPPLSDIDHGEYDNLFVVSKCQCRWWSTVTNLQYGATSG